MVSVRTIDRKNDFVGNFFAESTGWFFVFILIFILKSFQNKIWKKNDSLPLKNRPLKKGQQEISEIPKNEENIF